MTAIVLLFLHHPVLIGASAVVRALWKGARGEVVRFGEDIAAVVFTRLRRLLGMRP